MELLPKDTDSEAALRVLQQVAVMVQGCWVVKRCEDVYFMWLACHA